MRAFLGLIMLFSLVFFVPSAVQQDTGANIITQGVENINSTEAKLKGEIESMGEFDNVSLRFRYREKNSGMPVALNDDVHPITIWGMDVENEVVYTAGGGGGFLQAYDIVKEKQIWNRSFGSSFYTAFDIVKGDNLVYAGLEDAKIVAYNPDTDTNIWNYSTTEYAVKNLEYRDGILYSEDQGGSSQHEVFALNVSNQNRLWSYDPGDFIDDIELEEDMMYIGTEDYRLVAYNISKSQMEWEKKLDSSVDSLKVIDDKIAVTNNGGVETYDLANQNLLWENLKDTEGSAAEFTLFNNSLYTETTCCPAYDTTDIRALNISNGDVILSFNTSEDEQSSTLESDSDTLYTDIRSSTDIPIEAYDDWRRSEVVEFYVTSPKNYSLDITDLTADTDYEFQAYVQGKNSSGTFLVDNGSISEFATTNLSLPGDGSPSNPYKISSCRDLKKMDDDRDEYYRLSNDIDCSDTVNWNGGKGFDPIGSSSPNTDLGFEGVLDGSKYRISDLYIDRPSESGLGIFDTLNNQAKVHNLHLVNVTIDGHSDIGAVSGSLTDEAEISKVTADANVTAGANAAVASAAVVGSMGAQAKVQRSFADGNITGGGYTGGLVGSAGDTDVVINRSYSFANVSADGGAVGGLVSYFRGDIYDSYSTGFVKAEGTWGEGGLIGSAGTVVDSYWDMNTSNYTTSDAGDNLTTQEMTGLDAPTYMSGFDFNNDWDVIQDHVFRDRDYPALKWQNLGNGSALDPYTISNCDQLQAMENDLQAYYVLERDINCSGTSTWNSGSGFDPVGSESTPFEAGFDGNGSKIYSLYIDRSSDQVGLFGHLSGSDIQNLSMIDADITGGSDTGIIAGSLDAGSEVNTSFVNGSVSGDENVGGVVGDLETSEIKSSYSLAQVSGSNYAGGLTGLNNLSLVNRSYSDGNSSGSNNGGLIGLDDGGSVAESYWDEESGADNSDGGIGLNTTDMQGCSAANQMIGFDFVNIWIPEDSDYPSFKWSKMNAANCSVMNWTAQEGVDGFKLYDNSTGTFNEIADIPKSASASDVIRGWMDKPSSGYICYHVTAYLNVYPDTKLESSPSNEVCKSW